MNFEKTKNTKALAWTIGIHALLLLVFVLAKYTLPAMQQVEDLGMEVNLGTTEDGFGDDQPEDMEDPAAADNVAVVNAADNADADDREVHTTDEADAPIVHSKPTPKKKEQKVVIQQPKPPTQVVKKSNISKPNAKQPTTQPAKKYVYAGSNGKGGNSAQNNKPGGNEGIGAGNGDMGVPGGTPGASNYTGVPGEGGTSINHALNGRNIVARPDPKAEFNEGGKVVIRVTVNRDGEIVNARVVSASNANLRSIALKKVQNVRFNKSTDAPTEQFGNITFNFRTTRK